MTLKTESILAMPLMDEEISSTIRSERLYDTRAELVIFSATESAADLASMIGLVPDKSFNRGDLVGGTKNRTGNRHKYSCIEYHSLLPGTHFQEDHLAALLTRLEPYRDAIRELSRTLQSGPQPPVRIWVFHTSYQETGGLGIEAGTIAQIADLNVGLKFFITTILEDLIKTSS